MSSTQSEVISKVITFSDETQVNTATQPLDKPFTTRLRGTRFSTPEPAPSHDRPSLMQPGSTILRTILTEEQQAICKDTLETGDEITMPVRIWIGRHGESYRNVRGAELKQERDAGLTENGWDEVKRTNGKIKTLHIEGGANMRVMYASDMQRTLQSADEVTRDTGIPVVATAILRERLDRDHLDVRNADKTGFSIPESTTYLGSKEDKASDRYLNCKSHEKDRDLPERAPDMLELFGKTVHVLAVSDQAHASAVESHPQSDGDSEHIVPARMDIGAMTHNDIVRFEIIDGLFAGTELENSDKIPNLMEGAFWSFDADLVMSGDPCGDDWKCVYNVTGLGPSITPGVKSAAEAHQERRAARDAAIEEYYRMRYGDAEDSEDDEEN